MRSNLGTLSASSRRPETGFEEAWVRTTGLPCAAGFPELQLVVERGFNCGLKIRMISSNWLMQSVLENPAFYGVKAHLFSPLNNLSRR